MSKLPIAYPVSYSDLGVYINDAQGKMIADIRGWGWMEKFDNPEGLQDSVGRFIADAINEKLSEEQSNE